jgi:hypothetical protein
MALNEEKIWSFLKSKGLNDYGISGLMGNLFAESGLNPKNLQNTYERSLGYSDDKYVSAVDGGSYTNFIYDAAGFGLAQWTYWSRKKALYEYVKSKNKSIGNLEAQLEFLYIELSESYKSVLDTLKTAKSVKEASNAVLLKFECPADQSVSMQNKRAAYGQNYYDKYAEKGSNVTMGVKTYQESDRVQLSKNFNSYEFRCGLGSPCSCSTILIDDKLVDYLQKIRDHFGKSITITSAYRCPSYNKSIGGATGSYHSKGMATDIQVKGVTPREVAKYAESIGIKGIGLYETQSDGHFVHIDTRTNKSFWYGQAQAPRSTFGDANSASGNNSSAITILKRGSSGDLVKDLQEKLTSMKYSLGKADGEYGRLTEEAVRKFQRDNNLDADGVAGPITLEMINKKTNIKSNRIRVTANVLNVRAGAGTNHSIRSTVQKGAVYEVLEEKDGWGRISGGWISLQYVDRV